MEGHEMENIVNEIRKEKRRKSSRRSSLANEIFNMINMNASSKESFDKNEFIKKYTQFRIEFIERQTDFLTDRIKQSSQMSKQMKRAIVKREELIESSPWDLLSNEQKEFLNKNDLKLEEVESTYKNAHADLINMFMKRMENNQKYLESKKCCYLRHVMLEKPSFAHSIALVENLNTID